MQSLVFKHMRQERINCQFDLINYTYTFKIYNGHCIIPYPSFFFFLRQSLRSKYLHMYNYQAALYKARHERQCRCWASNQTATHHPHGGFLSCPMIIIHLPVPREGELKNDIHQIHRLRSTDWGENLNEGWGTGHRMYAGWRVQTCGNEWHKHLLCDGDGGGRRGRSARLTLVVDKPLTNQVPVERRITVIITVKLLTISSGVDAKRSCNTYYV